MCKKINRLFPVLMICYIGGSFLIGYFLHGIHLPVWFSMILSQLLILTPVLAFVFFQKVPVFRFLPYRMLSPKEFILSLLFGYSLIPLVQLLNTLSMFFTTNKIEQATSGLFQYPFLVQILIIAVIPPCIEEFVFRGMFFHSYRKNGVLGAALLSGFIFGVVHMNINQFIYAFVLGVIFALLVEGTGSMLTSMTAHFAINTFSLIVIRLTPASYKNNAAETVANLSVFSKMVQIYMLIAIAMGFCMLAFVIYRSLVTSYGRWNYIQEQLKAGIGPKNGERFITIPLGVTLIISIAIMIYSEYF